jgi:hypothetical protein
VSSKGTALKTGKHLGTYLLNLGDREIQAPMEVLDVASLKLDPENIRFKHVGKVMSQEEMIDYFFDVLDGTDELMNGIKENGGLMDPLIVQKKGSGLIVKEGNRRLACLKTLVEIAEKGEEDIVKEKFDKAPCAIFPDDVTEEEMAIYLARVHVIGKKVWPPENKAWLVYWMDGGSANMPYGTIAKNFGMSKGTVQRMIEAYKYTFEYSKKFRDARWLRKYSYFDEIYKGRKKLPSEYVINDGVKDKLSDTFLEWFGGLISDKRLRKGEQVRQVVKMFEKKDQKAIEELTKHGIDPAWKLFETHHPETTNKIYGAIDMATIALQNIKMMEIEELGNDDARIEKLKELRSSVDQILGWVGKTKGKGRGQ